MRAKRLRFAIIPEVTVTDTEADLFYLKIEKLIQFFRKYITESDKGSMFVNYDKKSSSVASDSCNSDVNLLNKDGNSEKDKDKDKDKDKEKGRKKKIDVNLLKIWLGTKGDPKWAFLQCDRIVNASRVMHIEVRIILILFSYFHIFLFSYPIKCLFVYLSLLSWPFLYLLPPLSPSFFLTLSIEIEVEVESMTIYFLHVFI